MYNSPLIQEGYGYISCCLLPGIGPSGRLLCQYHHQMLQGNFQVTYISGSKKKTKRNIAKRKTAQGFFGARGCGISQKFFPLKVIFKASVDTHTPFMKECEGAAFTGILEAI